MNEKQMADWTKDVFRNVTHDLFPKIANKVEIPMNETAGTWKEKPLPIETDMIAPGQAAVSVRAFLPLPEGVSNLPDDTLCRPYRIRGIDAPAGDLRIVAVSVGAKFVQGFDEVVKVEPGQVVVAWVVNAGTTPAAFKGRFLGEEFDGGPPSSTKS